MKVLFVGNHLQESGHTVGVSVEIGNRLKQKCFGALFTSAKVNKPLRLLDMVRTIIYQRKDYSVAQVDVYSGPAFAWALLSVMLLKIVKKADDIISAWWKFTCVWE